MSYQVDFTQKKNSTFLVAAAPVEAGAPRAESRVEANPYQNAGAFLAVARRANCSDRTFAALEAAANRAQNQPETPIVCCVDDIEVQQLAAMGLPGVSAAPTPQAAPALQFATQ